MEHEELNDQLQQKMQESATRADPDTETKLVRLDQLAALRRKDPVIEREYEKLRAEVAPQLLDEGPRFYLDSSGVKRFAFAVQPEPVEVNVAGLIRLEQQGQLHPATLNLVAPRKIDKEAFRREVSAGRITQAQVAQVARIGKGTAFVRFSDPFDAA